MFLRSRRRLFPSNFDKKEIEKILPKIPLAQKEIEKVTGREIDFPKKVHAMTDKEIKEGQRFCEWSEYEKRIHCGGHGLFVRPDIIKINPTMIAEGILANYVHETLHFALPDMPHDEVRRKTDEVLRVLP